MIWDQVVERWLAAGENYRRDTGYALRDLPCTYCGDPAQTLDHVVPRSRGGSDASDNLVPVCRSCNGAKSARLLVEWADVLRSEVARADKRRRALQAVEAMLGIRSEATGRAAGPIDPASCLHDWQEVEIGEWRCGICDTPWTQAA